MKITVFLLSSIFLLFGCASTPKPTGYTLTPAAEPKKAEPRKLDPKVELDSLHFTDVIPMQEPNLDDPYDDSRYDFPVVVNSKVEGWINYFTGRGRPHMERYLGRSSRYIPVMRKILKKSGMPEDLVYLALIESGFNLRAKSRARAVGPWQFIKGTGQRYGLKVAAWVDERRDPIRSTEAAARYLKDLYLMFESWYLAAAAYNAGEYKILRAIDSAKSNNYWHLCETSFIKRETKDYIPKLIAAAIIAKNPERYGFDLVSYQEPLEYESVQVDFPLHLKEVSRITQTRLEDIEELNPHYRRSRLPPGGSHELRLPPGTKTLVVRTLAQLKPASAQLPTQVVVKKGDTIQSLSRKYRVSTRQIAEMNNLNPKEKLSPGLALIIGNAGSQPTATSKKVEVAESKNEEPTGLAGFLLHTVKKGESLWSIAEKYNVTINQLFKWNKLNNSRIHAGKRLKVKSNGSISERETSALQKSPSFNS